MRLKFAKANDKNYYFFCEAEQTQSGFYHKVSMFENDVYIATEIVTYLNRTWEKYTFQSAIKSVIRSSMLCESVSKDVHDNLLEQVENGI